MQPRSTGGKGPQGAQSAVSSTPETGVQQRAEMTVMTVASTRSTATRATSQGAALAQTTMGRTLSYFVDMMYALDTAGYMCFQDHRASEGVTGSRHITGMGLLLHISRGLPHPLSAAPIHFVIFTGEAAEVGRW